MAKKARKSKASSKHRAQPAAKPKAAKPRATSARRPSAKSASTRAPSRAKSAAAATPASSADTSAAVDALMASLAHPHKPAIELLRRTLLGLDARIAEGVKWNAPSFRTSEYFATVHLRSKLGLGLILHLGAKARAPARGLAIEDPTRLLQWLASDRALIEFTGLEDLRRKQRALEAVLRQWVKHV